MKTKTKIGILLSGGVDSSYCAYLLQKHAKNYGFEEVELYGLYLKLHNNEKKHATYIKNCEELSKKLGFHFEALDLQEKFHTEIIDNFIEAYKNASTPNPCAICNPTIKFGYALNYLSEKYGCEYLCSGHYARIVDYDGNKHIAKAKDDSKDQSYFLYALKEDQRKRLIFPLGDKLKEDVKKEALSLMPWLGTLETYKDSQEICFVKDSYVDVIKTKYKVDEEGVVLDINGNEIGLHKGYMNYTIGKRKGFTIKGAHTPNYVLQINPANNSITVGSKEDLARDEVIARNVNLAGDLKGDYTVKIRYKSSTDQAEVKIIDDLIIANFKSPVYGVANGQAMVVYDGEIVVGGGLII